jgi:5-methylcytosine-specific restriction endonuclease McrA
LFVTHYLHYWTPLRAELAFGDTQGRVRYLDNGWYRTLLPGDVLWILSRSGDQLALVFRGQVAAKSRTLSSIPSYAVGNSDLFIHFRARFTASSGSAPRSIPFPIRNLKRIRFKGRSARVDGPLNQILVGPLAALRRVEQSTVPILEECWRRRASYPWRDLADARYKAPVALDVHPPRPKRYAQVTVSRVVRDTATVAALKQLHNHRCQVCGKKIVLSSGAAYSEGHHLKPLGNDHDGPDTAANIVIVCPNHHVQLDFAAISLNPEKLRLRPAHVLDQKFIAYHNRLVRRHRARVT